MHTVVHAHLALVLADHRQPSLPPLLCGPAQPLRKPLSLRRGLWRYYDKVMHATGATGIRLVLECGPISCCTTFSQVCLLVVRASSAAAPTPQIAAAGRATFESQSVVDRPEGEARVAKARERKVPRKLPNLAINADTARVGLGVAAAQGRAIDAVTVFLPLGVTLGPGERNCSGTSQECERHCAHLPF